MLDHQPDGKTVAWANEASGHSGKIKSVATFEKDQRTCRTVRVLNRAGGVTGEGRFDFCRQAVASGNADTMEMLQQEIELTVAALEMQRKAVIADNLSLSDKEQAFWPVYNAYREAMRKVIDQRIAIIGEYLHAVEQPITDERQAARLLDRYLRVLAGRIDIKKRFRSQFMKVLPATKVLRFYQLDNRFDLLVNMEIARSVPLAGQ